MSDVDDDGDEVAITEGMEPESKTGDAPESDDDGPDEFESQGSSFVAGETSLKRSVRPISDKTRQLYKTAAAAIAAQRKTDGDTDDSDEDIQYDEAAAPITPTAEAKEQRDLRIAAAARQAMEPTAEAVAPAPTLDPQVQQLREKLTAKQADLDAREKRLLESERSGDVGRLRETYLEKGSAAVIELVKKWTGASTDDEVKEEIADLITDLSGQVLGVPLSSEIKNRIEAKRALKSVKAYKQSIGELEKVAEGKRAEVQEAEQRSRAIHMLGEEMKNPELVKAYPFLAAEDNSAELIYDVVEAHLKRDGTMLQWTEAAKRANDYLTKQASAYYDKRKHLFSAAPANPGGNGTPKQRPQADPQDHRRSLAPPQEPKPTTPPPNNGKWNPEAHRRQTKARMRAAFTRQPADD